MGEAQVPGSGAPFDGSCRTWHISLSAEAYYSHHVIIKAGGSVIRAYITVTYRDRLGSNLDSL